MWNRDKTWHSLANTARGHIADDNTRTDVYSNLKNNKDSPLNVHYSDITLLLFTIIPVC